MNSVQIGCFLEAARSGSFTEAAEKLYMTQPTFGRQISSLEKELGFSLFVRGWKSNRLTAQGEILRDGLSGLTQQFDALLESARKISSGENGTLRIGMLEGQLMDQQLYELIQRFRSRYPGIEVSTQRHSFHDLLTALRTGGADIAVTLELDVAERPEFRWRHLYSLNNEIVFPKKYPQAQRENLTLRDFSGETFVELEAEESNVVSVLMRRSCQEAGFTPRFLHVPDLRAQITAVELGSGIAAFNQYHQACNHPRLAHCPLPELPDVDFCLAWDRDTGNPAVELFLTASQAEPDGACALPGRAGNEQNAALK